VNAPNALSCFRILLTLPAVAAILRGSWGAASAVLAVALLTDFLDGQLARRLGQSTELGKILDPVADKLLAAGVLLALVGVGRVPGELAWVVLVRDAVLLGFGWLRVRGGGPVPSAEIPGKVAFAVLGCFLGWEVAGTGWPSWVPGFVGAVYLLGGLSYARRMPSLPLGRILKGER
jgi:CDP-diacylglycerol--glycerol-3-phosphate 3-phosphatidyltransferase